VIPWSFCDLLRFADFVPLNYPFTEELLPPGVAFFKSSALKQSLAPRRLRALRCTEVVLSSLEVRLRSSLEAFEARLKAAVNASRISGFAGRSDASDDVKVGQRAEGASAEQSGF
jgi:hypothetical protein